METMQQQVPFEMPESLRALDAAQAARAQEAAIAPVVPENIEMATPKAEIGVFGEDVMAFNALMYVALTRYADDAEAQSKLLGFATQRYMAPHLEAAAQVEAVNAKQLLDFNARMFHEGRDSREQSQKDNKKKPAFASAE